MPKISLNFGDEEYRLLGVAAQAQGISPEEFMRLSVARELAGLQNKPWMRFIGFVASGDFNSGQRIDEVVYGREGSGKKQVGRGEELPPR